MIKPITRGALLLLACLMALSSFSACAGKKNKPVDTEPSNNDDPDKETYDWNQEVFTFMERELNPSVNTYYEVFSEGEKGEIINDALFRRNKVIEETFHVILESKVESANNTTRRNTVDNVLKSGSDVYSVLMDYGGNTMMYAVNGQLRDLNDFDAFDFSQSYWYSETMEDTRISGKNAFAVGDICTASYTATCVIYFNKELAQTYGIDNIYDLVFEGNWTFEEFSTIGKEVTRDLTGDGMDASDQYMLAAANWAYQPYFYGQGFKLLGKDENGNPSISKLREEQYDALKAIIDLCNSDDCWYLGKYSSSEMGTTDVFTDERALFWAQLMVSASKLRDTSFAFGILPLPKRNSAQERYVSYLHTNTSLMAIPVTNQNASHTSILIERMCKESERIIKPQYFDALFDGIIVRDPESTQTLDIIYDNVFMDMVQPLVHVGGTIDTAIRNLMDIGMSDAIVTSWEKQVERTGSLLQSIITAYEEKIKNIPEGGAGS